MEALSEYWLEEDEAVGMLGWPHSGFGAYVGLPIEGREGWMRVARYSARAPVAESRLRYDAVGAEVELLADRADGPYAGVHRMAALEFLARWVDHVPECYEVRVRYAGAYATRRRVWCGGAEWSWSQGRRSRCRGPSLRRTGRGCGRGDGGGRNCSGWCSRWTSRYAHVAGAKRGSSGS